MESRPALKVSKIVLETFLTNLFVAGNLTKHILKHHKTEQKDYIGTDDIIIKKGKKSVKDPAAIDFLEKSMIVLQQAPLVGNNNNNSHDSSGGTSMRVENSAGGGSPCDQKQCFFLSLGLDNGSIDLKAESVSENDDEESGGDATSCIDMPVNECGVSSNLGNSFSFFFEFNLN